MSNVVDAMNFVFSMFGYYVNFVFEAELIPGAGGVSLGWMFVCSSIFAILIRYAVAIPRINMPSLKRDSKDRKEDE